MLERIAPGPIVTLNRAVAVAEVRGPQAALELIDPLLDDQRLRRNHRLHAVEAHLLELAGRFEDARGAISSPPAWRRASPNSVTCRRPLDDSILDGPACPSQGAYGTRPSRSHTTTSGNRPELIGIVELPLNCSARLEGVGQPS